ncbi:hypothetical protein [Desulforamulus aeronauticus]|uniref:Uncharacterized protein n=1 Tax=Desulforamulus aeronauticus DSM 10349 TaxID=1121421 RepID=A0A1M6UMU6_9FIRM|nr:hypothetical protein [Desulforamulus aeronauticus]SHK70517.1 hypothetical protein SAMN02745123_02827 [Desulforamulus aeronauticus DSM 10349]
MMMTFADGITGFLWSLMMIVGMTLPILLMIWALSAVGERVAERKTSGSTRLDKGEITVDDFQRLRNQ